MSDAPENGGSSSADRAPKEAATSSPPANAAPTSSTADATPVRKSAPTPPPAARSKPRIGDSRPAPVDAEADAGSTSSGRSNGSGGSNGNGTSNRNQPRKRNRQRNQRPDTDRESGDGNAASPRRQAQQGDQQRSDDADQRQQQGGQQRNGGGAGESADGKPRRKRRRNRSKSGSGENGRSPQRNANNDGVVEHVVAAGPVELDESQLESRRGRSRKGKAVGRYVMAVSKRADATHIAILEGRNLIEYYVSRAADDTFQIHGNIYLGKVQNVLPGMEAAFVDIATPKNAVLYRGDVQYDKSDFEGSGNGQPKIEQILKAKQTVLCQVTKNPIAHKGARLTTEVSLPGRFVVLVPNSDTYGISKRLPDGERKRLRKILDKARPKEHGIIVRTAAENVTAEEIQRDVKGLLQQWEQIEKLANQTKSPALLYREPEMSVRVIREEFNKEYRAVIIDDQSLYDEVSSYVSVITPALADRVEFYDEAAEGLPIFERYHVHEQLHKALDRKVWLPSGGSLIIEHTEALTVIDVNTGKNVGSSSLEETVYRNNLEAAEEVAHQLRLRDIGGIIVIDFVDMEAKKNRDDVTRTLRQALARDKTRTQLYEIGELGLAEMTRKRIGEGLLESLSSRCPHCDGRGHLLETGLR